MFVAKRCFHRHSRLFLPKQKKPQQLCGFTMDTNKIFDNPLNECEKSKASNTRGYTSQNNYDNKQCQYTNPLNECENSKHKTTYKACRINPLNECEKTNSKPHNNPCCENP